jgi:hypothetical protein
MPAKKPQHQAGFPRTDRRPRHPLFGAKVDTAEQDLAALPFDDNTHPWGERQPPPNETLRPRPLAA